MKRALGNYLINLGHKFLDSIDGREGEFPENGIVKLPEFHFSSGKIFEICVRENEMVQTGATLLVVDYEEASVEIPSPCKGIVENITVEEGEPIEMGMQLVKLKKLI